MTMIAPDLAALVVPVSELRSLPRNPRVGNVDAIARSLETFGQRKPIVALPDGTVLAGNHTLAAARKLGWHEIAVVRVNDDETTAKAFALADNRTGDLGSYDESALAEMIAAVADADLELLKATAYTPEFLAALLADPDFDVDTSPELGGLSYSILVECANEHTQARLLERLEEEGFSCKPIVT